MNGTDADHTEGLELKPGHKLRAVVIINDIVPATPNRYRQNTAQFMSRLIVAILWVDIHLWVRLDVWVPFLFCRFPPRESHSAHMAQHSPQQW